jgi:acylphosphatase
MRAVTTTIAAAAHPEEDHTNNDNGTQEIIARRIIVKGDVQGGYYRSCVLNEVNKKPIIGWFSLVGVVVVVVVWSYNSNVTQHFFGLCSFGISFNVYVYIYTTIYRLENSDVWSGR